MVEKLAYCNSARIGIKYVCVPIVTLGDLCHKFPDDGFFHRNTNSRYILIPEEHEEIEVRSDDDILDKAVGYPLILSSIDLELRS